MKCLASHQQPSGPRCRENICPFVTLDDIEPSRFVLAYDDNYDVAFVGLDPKRLGESTDDGTMTDFGDNKTRYKQTNNNIHAYNNDSDSDDSENNDSDGDDSNDGMQRNRTVMSSSLLKFLALE